MNATYLPNSHMLDLGLLVARLVLGLLMAAHGTQKLFGWFGGYGLGKTGEFFVQLGFPPGRLFASAASLGEVTGGLLLAFGFLGPVGPALMMSVMLVAAISVHWKNGLFASTNGVELPLLYMTGAFGIALAGYGHYSLDALFGISSVWTETVTWVVLLIGVVGGIVNLMLRRRPAQP
jgi:putative oxidoreductase